MRPAANSTASSASLTAEPPVTHRFPRRGTNLTPQAVSPLFASANPNALRRAFSRAQEWFCERSTVPIGQQLLRRVAEVREFRLVTNELHFTDVAVTILGFPST
jgi:hypothetical protein